MSPKKSRSRATPHGTEQSNSSEKASQEKTVDNLLKIVLQLESQLQNSKDKSSDKFCEMRKKLCEDFCGIILKDPVVSMRKDCIHRLWRGCFYPQITTYRCRIAKEKKSQRKTGAPSELLKEIEAKLRKFLNETTILYSYLVSRYEAMLKEGKMDGIVPNFHKLLIHLGDLHRYSNEITKAESCYMKASVLGPGRGNPYNQLAVVSQQPQPQGSPKTCISLYWYVRSLLATYEPFDTSHSNMSRLFSANKIWLDKNPQIQSNDAAGSNRKHNSLASRHFLARYVHLHGLFFSPEETHEVINEKSKSVLSDLTKMLREQTFGEALVIKMITINVFSVLFPKMKPPALSFAFSFGGALAQQICNTLQNADKQATENSTVTKGELMKNNSIPVKMLSPLLLFCDWVNSIDYKSVFLQLHSQNCHHERVLSTFWKQICDLANQLQDKLSKFPVEALPSSAQILKEHDQMKGFLPFASFIDHVPKSSFFIDNTEDDNEGFLITSDAVSALERHKASGSDSTGNYDDVHIRIQRFITFVRRSSQTLQGSNGNSIIPQVVFDQKTQRLSVFEQNDTIMTELGTEIELPVKPSTEVEDDDDEVDFIVYSGIEAPTHQPKSKNIEHEDKFDDHAAKILKTAESYTIGKHCVGADLSESKANATKPPIYVDKDKNEITRNILSSFSVQRDVRVNKQNDAALSLLADKGQAVDTSVRVDSPNLPGVKPINPPPGFEMLPRKDSLLLNASKKPVGLVPPSPSALERNPTGILGNWDKNLSSATLPPYVLDSIGINGKNILNNSQGATLPPPGFTQLLQNGGSHIIPAEKYQATEMFGNWNPSLLFEPSKSLFSPDEVMKNDSLRIKEDVIQTKNPFVTPYSADESTFGRIYQNNLFEYPLHTSGDSSISAENARKHELTVSVTGNSSLHTTWNPFI